jgi:hypothetical protein
MFFDFDQWKISNKMNQHLVDRMVRRAQFLEELGLAESLGGLEFRLAIDWEFRLKEIGYRRDIVKQMYRDLRELGHIESTFGSDLRLWNGVDRIEGEVVHKDFTEDGVSYPYVYVKTEDGVVYYHIGRDTVDVEIGDKAVLDPAKSAHQSRIRPLDIDGNVVIETRTYLTAQRRHKYRDVTLDGLMLTEARSHISYLRLLNDHAGHIPAQREELGEYLEKHFTRLSAEDRAVVEARASEAYIRAPKSVVAVRNAQARARKTEIEPLLSREHPKGLAYVKAVANILKVKHATILESRGVDIASVYFTDLSEVQQEKIAGRFDDAVLSITKQRELFDQERDQLFADLKVAAENDTKQFTQILKRYTGVEPAFSNEQEIGKFVTAHFGDRLENEQMQISRAIEASTLAQSIIPKTRFHLSEDAIAEIKESQQQVHRASIDPGVKAKEFAALVVDRFGKIADRRDPIAVGRFVDTYFTTYTG